MSTPFTPTPERIAEVCREFRIPGTLIDAQVITRGNINTTFKVTFSNEGKEKPYLLQRVNTYVFTDPKEIMSNIDLITNHIRNKVTSNEKANLHFHHCADGNNYYFDTDGEFWRLINYIDSLTFDLCDDPEIIRGTGYAFGEFQTILEGFDVSLLHETIPNFHNTPKRLEKFFSDVEKDEYGRAHEVTEEIEFTKKYASLASRLTEMLNAGQLPLRVTHNDTKSNNVLFDRETKKPLTVIDLDTVMPGLVAFDFGDAIRSAANTATEDEADLSKVSLDIEKFRIFSEGFLEATAGKLTQTEIDTLVLGAFTLTFEQAVRFLDDYLTGDKYFRTTYPKHNLDRAKNQYALAKDILNKTEKLDEIIYNTTRLFQ